MKLALSGTLEGLVKAKAERLGITAQEALRMLAVQWVQGEPQQGPARDPQGTREVPGEGVGGGVLFPEVRNSGRRGGGERRERRGFDDDEPPGFAEFWSAYPRKEKRGDARKAWLQTSRIRPPLADLLAAIDRARKSRQWQRDDGQFIPLPASWLRAECWGDCGEVLPFEAPPDPELSWRVETAWSDRVRAYRAFMRETNGVTPSVDPVLTAEIRALIEQSLRTYDAGLLAPEDRDRWIYESITRAAGVGHFHSPWHIGQDPRAPGVKYLDHALPWRNGNTQKFADLYFENRDILGAARGIR